MGMHMFATVKMEVHVTMWMVTVVGSVNLDIFCPTVHKIPNIHIVIVYILKRIFTFPWPQSPIKTRPITVATLINKQILLHF